MSIKINGINFTGLIVLDILGGSIGEHGGSDRWLKVHNIIKGVILSFAECTIKDLNFCEIQYCLILSNKLGKFCMFCKICSDKLVSVLEGELSDY